MVVPVFPREARRDLSLAVAAGVAAGALVILQLGLAARVIRRVFIEHATLADTSGFVAALAAVAILRAGMNWAASVLASRSAGLVKAALRDALAGTILGRGPAAIGGERSGELTNTLIGGVEAIEEYVSQYLLQAALACLVPALVLVTVWSLDPLSGAVLLVTGPLIPLFMFLIGSSARNRTRRQWVTLSRLSARFLDAVRALPVLKVFGHAAAEIERIEEASERFRTITMEVLRIAFLSALVLELLATIGVALVAVEAGLRLLYGRLAFEPALLVLMLTPEFYRPLRALGSAFHAGLAGREASARIRELVAVPARNAAPAWSPALCVPGKSNHAWRLASPPAIRLDGVSFTYPGHTRPAVCAVSFAIPAGSTVALVGPSGAGKSTLAHMLLRFIDPDEGGISIDNQMLAHWLPDRWRDAVAWVPQQPHLFHATLRDNLLLARPDASTADLERALGAAHLDEVVAGLPDGLDTVLGERGERLSGGQAQRVALARAFLKDAPVLILDEPTAQLDPGNESIIRDAIRLLCRNRTVLLVAHRLTTVFEAAGVVVLSEGRVIECGTHGDLLAQGSQYARMVAAYTGSA
jgi:thiol reductant ABC exporter CydD subunit